MNQFTPTPGNLLDRLLEAMPKMAQAVNSFESEENQRLGLIALLHAAGAHTREQDDAQTAAAEPTLSIVPPLAGDTADEELGEASSNDDAQQDEPHKAKRTRARRPASKKAYPRAKDIDFRPEGKMSLRDFIADKQPTNFYEKNLVIVYYLKEHLEMSAVDVGDVLAGYVHAGWKPPSDPENSLRQAASKKHWLDTSDTRSIKITYHGSIVVEHDMPIKKDKTA